MALVEFDICQTEKGRYTYSSNNGAYFVWLRNPQELDSEKSLQGLVLSNVPMRPTKQQIIALEQGKKEAVEAELWAAWIRTRRLSDAAKIAIIEALSADGP